MSLYNKLFEELVNPLYDFARGTKRGEYNRKLEKTQWLSKEEIRRAQEKNFRQLINHAYETVPYYRRVFKERGLTQDDVRTIEDLKKLPVLTKGDVNRNLGDLVSNQFKQERLIPYQSGGSGEPLRFYITRESRSWELAAEIRAYRWAGYKPGDTCFLLWGSSMDLEKRVNLSGELTRRLERIEVGDAWQLSDDVLRGFTERLIKRRPKVIKGYANAVYMLAKYIKENDVINVRPTSVITSAEKLIEPRRRDIEEAFGCQVYDYYGSREIGAIAAECDHHSGYHISAENVVLEFVRDGEHVSPGEQGEIVATNLRNFGMPLIRYRIGDTGILSDEMCGCGRGLPVMKSIEGRVSQFVSMFDRDANKVIPLLAAGPGIIAKAMDQVPVEDFRVLQEDLAKITILIVPKQGFSADDERFILDFLYGYVGKYIGVEIRRVDNLPSLPSGKRSVVVSMIDPFG